MADEKCDRDREHDEIVVEYVGRREQAAGRQRRGLEFECGIALPQPGETGGQHQRQRDLHGIGSLNARAPHPHRRKYRLDFLPAGAALLEHHGLREVHGVREGVPDAAAERDEAERDQRRDGGDGRADRAPSSARQQRNRNQNAELRFVGEAADQQAREPGPAIEQMQRAAEQCRGKKSILAVADVDEHGGERGCDQQRLRTGQDRAHRGQIGRKTGREPDRKTPGVGNGGHQDGDRKEEWRIMPAVERHLAAAEYGRLRSMLERRHVGLRRPALPGQRASGIDVGKVGADRLAVAVDQAVRHRDPAGHRDDANAEQDQAVAACTRGGQPLAGSQPLPDMSHFAAEFYECCANLASAL